MKPTATTYAKIIQRYSLLAIHSHSIESNAAIWPELKKMLSDGGVYDYSIYWDKDTNILFACQKTKGEESSQDMGANPIVQKWWDYMADIMEVNPDNSPVTIPLPEVFHMD